MKNYFNSSITLRPFFAKQRKVVFAFCLVSFLGFQMAWGQVVRVATFKKIEGVITVESENGGRLVQIGDPVHQYDKLETASNAGASLVFSDGTFLVLGPKTAIKVEQYEFDVISQTGAMVIELIKGQLRFATGILGRLHPEKIKLRTPYAVTSLRGTDFVVELP